MVKILRENSEMKQMPLECIQGATLLSKEEAENLLTRKERTCKGTREAINNGLRVFQNGNSYYWLRSTDYYYDYACSIDRSGDVSYNYDVDDAMVGLRPALILNLKSSNLMIGDSFEFGDYTFKIISNDLALCDVIVDACPFNQSEEDGSDYETSYIKDKVNDWFKEVKRNSEYKEWDVETDDEIFNGKKGEWTGW